MSVSRLTRPAYLDVSYRERDGARKPGGRGGVPERGQRARHADPAGEGTGVAGKDRDMLSPAADWPKDPADMDNNVAVTHYDILANRFQVGYEDGRPRDHDSSGAQAAARAAIKASEGPSGPEPRPAPSSRNACVSARNRADSRESLTGPGDLRGADAGYLGRGAGPGARGPRPWTCPASPSAVRRTLQQGLEPTALPLMARRPLTTPIEMRSALRAIGRHIAASRRR